MPQCSLNLGKQMAVLRSAKVRSATTETRSSKRGQRRRREGHVSHELSVDDNKYFTVAFPSLIFYDYQA